MLIASTAIVGASSALADNNSAAQAAGVDQAALAAVIAHERRAEDRARDQYRHPLETLTFFQVAPSDTVAEYAPGGGWYSKILAPYVAAKGKFIGLNFAPDPLPFPEDRKERIRSFSSSFPESLSGLTGLPKESIAAFTSDAIPEDMKGTVDFILVPRMMHNLLRWNVADNELKAMRDLLKPGGRLGIVQHRAKDGTSFTYADGNNGYLRTDTVVKYIEALGFELVDSSEVNANPKDTADYPKGVWTLPPNYAEGDTDKAKYEAIGESDRMTLMFKKVD
jgi:predicted methyltransferase